MTFSDHSASKQSASEMLCLESRDRFSLELTSSIGGGGGVNRAQDFRRVPQLQHRGEAHAIRRADRGRRRGLREPLRRVPLPTLLILAVSYSTLNVITQCANSVRLHG